MPRNEEFFLVALLLSIPGLALAQQATPTSAPVQAKPAPKLGHPLDPADVPILTSKADSFNRSPYGTYAAAYGYLSYPIDAPLFRQPLFVRVSTATRAPFAPLHFGRIGKRPFGFIRGSALVTPHPHFLLHGLRGRTSLSFGSTSSTQITASRGDTTSSLDLIVQAVEFGGGGGGGDDDLMVITKKRNTILRNFGIRQSLTRRPTWVK